ncbi:ATP-binding protein [Verminephrobacter aporrectodeae subsp. tuberculatae]|uniref:NACHT domain-containing protein n=1 Tax=Verminephrobacter aporrectodeae TaxID=1110389 RepID=UPI002242C6B2|nr:NACHT domain-containing protein [Verminephrobacter aporrectodeae]MCW8208977.1 ATP-binding protein [Verminephrobacter aporrectodeae subsp. tuberculatae]
METCLGGKDFIDYTRAPGTTRYDVEKELDGAANAQRFFQALEVKHSDKGVDSIEHHVTQRLRRHATVEGIETLKNRAVSWSIQRNQPPPEGWITFDVLKTTLKLVAPDPLPENFIIPQGYNVPDKTFHKGFIASIEAAPRQPIVLIGPPGRGKSTYLSKVCECLRENEVPVVRHHYYLSSTDRTRDRLTSFSVEGSLRSQVECFHSVASEQNLSEILGTCAAYYKEKGKPFVIILDGLDHVWRTHGHDKRPLDEIFNQILPLADNLVLVVGTQPVDDTELPNRLLTKAPRNTWQELPAMSGNAVLQYLRKEVDQTRLRIASTGAHAKKELQSAAAELRTRTNGHPLHVIYATEELVRSKRPLSKWNVQQLSGDLSRDVKHYYDSLWQSLCPSQKDVLRLICGFPFFWPKQAFADIATLTESHPPVVTAVEHLLHNSEAGLKAFHESLIIFIRQTDNFKERIAELTPHVETWLSNSAPTALRVNWLWAVQAKQGRPEQLIEGLQRDWVLQRLQEGYPGELFESLFCDAEEHAIQRMQYADAYRLRHLKHRLLDNPEYKLLRADTARLKACTWTLAPDASVIDEAIASRHEASIVDLTALSLALTARGASPDAIRCADEAHRRHLGESHFTERQGGSEPEFQAKELYLVKAFTTLEVANMSLEWAAEIVDKNSFSIVHKFLEVQVEKQNLKALVDIAVALPTGVPKLMVCEAAVRTAAIAGADLAGWSEFQQMSCGALIGCLAAMAGKVCDVWTRPLEFDWYEGNYREKERQDSLSMLAHDWFFGAAHLELIAKDKVFLLKAPKCKGRENVSIYLDHLGNVGRKVAGLLAAPNTIPFSYLYEEFKNFRCDYQRDPSASDFRRALHVIAIDLHLLNSRSRRSPLVDANELLHAMEQTWFDADQFRTQYASGSVKALSDEAADQFIQKQRAALDARVNVDPSERLMAALELCEVALRHGFRPLASDLCRRTWELVLGYGQRKDPALPDVMVALEYLEPLAPDETRRLLAEISPQVHNVFDYTDGKGTRHVLAQADDLLAKLDRGALVKKYREHTEAGDWYEAESSMTAFMTTASADSMLASAVLRTGIHAGAIDTLRTAADAGNTNAARLLDQAEQHIGADVGQLCEPRSGNSVTDGKPFPNDVKTYGVADLQRLLADLKEHSGIRSDVLSEWYHHWEAHGDGSELIKALEPFLLSDKCRDGDLHTLLDLAFSTKRRLEGPAKAFPYIVQAQIFNGGWFGPNFEKREKSEARLKLVVKEYPHRCDEFFRESAFSWYSKPRRKRIIPSSVMVYFLGLQDKTPEAIQFAESMVRSVQEDTRTFCLEIPDWAKKLAVIEGNAD